MKRYILLLCLPLAAQERTLQCDERTGDRRRESFCEMREVTVSAAGSLEVDGRQNGGIQVKGWKQSNILVRAKVQAQAATESEARSLVSQVRIETVGNRVRAEGPSTRDREWWSTSYEIFVPQAIDLTLRAHNGGIGILDVRGSIDFSTVNGGISLARVAGNVRGRTVNGGVSAQLEGERWDGEGLDLETTNGGVTLQVPDRYSARLETGTVNGGLRIDFPVTVQGSITKRLNVPLGSGGPTIRAVTVNGGVTVRQKSRPI